MTTESDNSQKEPSPDQAGQPLHYVIVPTIGKEGVLASKYPMARTNGMFSFGHKGAEFRDHSRAYSALKEAVKEGYKTYIFPVDMVKLSLEEQGINQEYFLHRLGYEKHYLQTISNHDCNKGLGALPEPLKQKLAAITNQPYEFWDRYYYSSYELPEIKMDMTRNIEKLVQQYENVSGQLTRKKNRDEKGDRAL